MKILTLNAHSHIEINYQSKLKTTVEGIAHYSPDIIAFQESNQSVFSPVYKETNRIITPKNSDNIPLRRDNHALCVKNLLSERSLDYYLCYLPIKRGFGIYDEGLAFLSKDPILSADSFNISKSEKYTDWRRRRILMITVEGYPELVFCNTHMGWWNDSKEPFEAQWKKTKDRLPHDRHIFIMGDFNSPSTAVNEGYGAVTNSGFFDCHRLARERDGGNTVCKIIDGWRDKKEVTAARGMQIDYIFSSRAIEVNSSYTVFNGRDFPTVSDHFGIMISCET